MKSFGKTVSYSLMLAFIASLTAGLALNLLEALCAYILVFGMVCGVFGAISATENPIKANLTKFSFEPLAHAAGAALIASFPVGAGFALGRLVRGYLT